MILLLLFCVPEQVQKLKVSEQVELVIEAFGNFFKNCKALLRSPNKIQVDDFEDALLSRRGTPFDGY